MFVVHAHEVSVRATSKTEQSTAAIAQLIEVVSLTRRPHFTLRGRFLILISFRGRVNFRTIVG
jgi:hypothetical protein